MSEEDPHLAPLLAGYRYPLYRRSDRPLPPDWSGPVYVWDIDNTYLHTEYASLRDLIRIRFEAARDKRPVPAAVELLAALRRGGAAPDTGGAARTSTSQGDRPPIYFVSASPKTMRPVLEKRMLIDGVLHDGITFRDLYKLRYLRDIFGYKLVALLLLRREGPRGAQEHLFGDDREHDPLVYTAYGRICAGALRGDDLRDFLRGHGVRPEARDYIVALADDLPPRDLVEWVFIRRLRPRGGDEVAPAALEREALERQERRRGGADAVALPDDPRLLHVDDYGQAAAVLRAAGRIGAHDLAAVVRAARARGLGQAPLQVVDAIADRLPADGVARARAEVAALDAADPPPPS